jgi:hypothetical protein
VVLQGGLDVKGSADEVLKQLRFHADSVRGYVSRCGTRAIVLYFGLPSVSKYQVARVPQQSSDKVSKYNEYLREKLFESHREVMFFDIMHLTHQAQTSDGMF